MSERNTVLDLLHESAARDPRKRAIADRKKQYTYRMVWNITIYEVAAELEDAPAPVGWVGSVGSVGTLVSSLVDFASPAGQVDNVTDADSGASLGIAITAANTANGTCGPRRTFPCLV